MDICTFAVSVGLSLNRGGKGLSSFPFLEKKTSVASLLRSGLKDMFH